MHGRSVSASGGSQLLDTLLNTLSTGRATGSLIRSQNEHSGPDKVVEVQEGAFRCFNTARSHRTLMLILQ